MHTSSLPHLFQVTIKSKSGSVSDFDYDPYTGFLCAVFKRNVREDNFPSVACFDTMKYQPMSKEVVFSPFPSAEDNLLPDQVAVISDDEPLYRTLPVEDDSDGDLFEQKPSKLHLQRLFGRSSRASFSAEARSEGVVSTEVVPVEGNEQQPQKPVKGPVRPMAPLHGPGHHVAQRKPYHFISVSKIHFDDCGRMWFYDCGTANEGTAGEKFYRRPILWAFEVIHTEDRRLVNKLYLRYELRTNLTHHNSISDFAVDINGDRCEDFHVYMANHVDNSIVVYDNVKGFDYQVFDEALTPVLSESKHVFMGEDYKFPRGVFSLSLAELNEHGYRDVFFTLGSGNGEYAVNSRGLRKRTHHNYYRALGYRGCGVNALNHVYDSFTRIMFFMHPETKSVRCWNTRKRLTPDNIGTVFVDPTLATGWSMKIDQSNNLWFMTNDFNYFTGEKVVGDLDAMNIYRAKVRDVVKGTVCDNEMVKGEPDDEEDTFDIYIDEFLQQLLGVTSGAGPAVVKPIEEIKGEDKPVPAVAVEESGIIL